MPLDTGVEETFEEVAGDVGALQDAVAAIVEPVVLVEGASTAAIPNGVPIFFREA